jgi:hypothetical protein
VAQSASYFREQAALCLEIARHISEPQKICVGSAAKHFERAAELEKAESAAFPTPDNRHA